MLSGVMKSRVQYSKDIMPHIIYYVLYTIPSLSIVDGAVIWSVNWRVQLRTFILIITEVTLVDMRVFLVVSMVGFH